MQWEDVTQEGLYKMLLPFGLNTKAIDRYVVAQSRQAIEVEDPLRLVSASVVPDCLSCLRK